MDVGVFVVVVGFVRKAYPILQVRTRRPTTRMCCHSVPSTK